MAILLITLTVTCHRAVFVMLYIADLLDTLMCMHNVSVYKLQQDGQFK